MTKDFLASRNIRDLVIGDYPLDSGADIAAREAALDSRHPYVSVTDDGFPTGHDNFEAMIRHQNAGHLSDAIRAVLDEGREYIRTHPIKPGDDCPIAAFYANPHRLPLRDFLNGHIRPEQREAVKRRQDGIFARRGPAVGDIVMDRHDNVTRIATIHGSNWQGGGTVSGRNFHCHSSGDVSFSGGFLASARLSWLMATPYTAHASYWVFDREEPRADGGIGIWLRTRVWQVHPGR